MASSFELSRMQNDRENEREKLFQDAHDRAMARRRRAIESNPNSVSPWEQKAILGRYQQQQDAKAFREHELNMLDRQGKNELAVAEQKKLGMIGQGATAAQANADASKYGADKSLEAHKYEWDSKKGIEAGHDQTSLTAGEKKIAGEIEVEKQRGKNATDAADVAGDWSFKSVQERGNADRAIAETNAQAAKDAAERKYEHDLELQAEKNLGRKPTDAEIKAFLKLREKPENKDKTSQEIWQILGTGAW